MLAENDDGDEMEGEDEVSETEHICHGVRLTRAMIEQTSPFATDPTDPTASHPVFARTAHRGISRCTQ